MATLNQESSTRARKPLGELTNTLRPVNLFQQRLGGGHVQKGATAQKSTKSHPVKTQNNITWQKFGENILPQATSEESHNEADLVIHCDESWRKQSTKVTLEEKPASDVDRNQLAPAPAADASNTDPTSAKCGNESNIVSEWQTKSTKLERQWSTSGRARHVKGKAGTNTVLKSGKTTGPVHERQGALTQPKTPSFARTNSKLQHIPPPRQQGAKTAPKSSPWGRRPTVPKSPNLQCVGKALSPETLQYKMRREAEMREDREAASAANDRSRERGDEWALRRTIPKSPPVLQRSRYRSSTASSSSDTSVGNRTFVARPMPDFSKIDDIPQFKPTMKSAASAASRLSSGKQAKPNTSVKKQSFKPMMRTIPKPFALQSVDKHEEAMYVLEQKVAREEEEGRRRRLFQPVPLREEILDGPTFVAGRSQLPLTEAVDLFPFSQERSERTLAFQEAQQARILEQERLKEIAAKEREELEMDKLRQEWEVRKFKPRPVPKSHYTPDVVHSLAHKRRGPNLWERLDTEEEEEREDQNKQSGGDEQDDSGDVKGDVTSCQDENSENRRVSITSHNLSALSLHTPVAPESKKRSILEGIRNSLSPYWS